MTKPIINKFTPLEPLSIQKYERYLPTAFDDTLTILQKLNMAIKRLDDLGVLSEQVITQWNAVMEWVLNEGLNDSVTAKLNEWLADGTLAEIINETLFGELTEKIDKAIADLNALMAKMPIKTLNAIGTGLEDVTEVVQTALDALVEGDTLYIPKGIYKVSKNTALTGFPQNDQPCLVLRNKKNVRIIGPGSVFKVETHAQGILEIQNCTDIVMEGVKFQGLGLFPAIDQNTGYSEKGTDTGGYDTKGFWGYYKNNCYPTNTRVNPSTNQAYGLFNGGYIGNIGIGVLIHNNNQRVNLKKCESTGFNYSGFQVGHMGDHVPNELGYAVNKYIVYEDCFSHDNYNDGFFSLDSEYLTYERCLVQDVGHPNASFNHTYTDPGYGIGLGGADSGVSKHTSILNCKIIGAKRRGIDAHRGEGLIARGNIIRDSFIGGIFFNTTTKVQRSFDFDISNNKLYNIGRGKSVGSPIQFSGVKGTDYSQDNALAKGKINNNLIDECFGWLGLIEVGTFDNLEINGNQIKGCILPANRAATTYKPFGIYMGYSLQEELNYFGACKDNIIDLGGFTDFSGGIRARNIQQGVISGNVVQTTSALAEFGISVWDCNLINVTGNVVWLSSSGKPYESLRNQGTFFNNDSRGGAPSQGDTPLSGKTIHLRIEATNGTKVLTVWSGEEYVWGAVNHTRGVQINLKNTQRGIIPQVKIEYGNATGMNSISDIGTYFYPYSMQQDNVVVALLTARGGVNIPYDTWNMGALNIYITI